MKLLVIMGIMLSANVFAGQCNYIGKDQARKALKILETAQAKSELFVVDQYCESCLDSYPRPILVDSFSIKKHQLENIYELSINTKITDLAYLYVEGDNLASLVGCKTIAVSRYLD